MSELFSMIKESSFPTEMFANSYSNEQYVETSINLLESVNISLEQETMSLYTRIAEAEDVKTENEAIKAFISSIQSQLTKLAMNLNASTSRFAIAVNNLCDSAKQDIANNSATVDSSYKYTDKICKFDLTKLNSPSVPKMNPYSLFEKEFNFVAQLMQELPVSASNKEKLNVVATVYDKFSKVLANSLTKDLMDEIFGGDVKSEDSFSKEVSKLFKDGDCEEREIDIEDYRRAVDCVNNSDDFVSSISEMNQKLINDLNHIVSTLGDVLYGAEKGKFKVDTKEDGIRNTIYSVDIYTSNKIMWLVQDKIRQIIDIYNKYVLALSIKMECILSCIRQSVDIINSFIYIAGYVENRKRKEEDTSSDDDLDNLDSDDSGDDLGSDNDDLGGNDDTDKEITEDDNDDLDEGDNTESDSGEDLIGNDDNNETPDTEGDPEPDFGGDEDTELKEAMIDFAVSVHEYTMAMHKANIYEHAAMIVLEDSPAGSGDGGGSNSPAGSGDGGGESQASKMASEKLSNVKNMSDKANEAKKGLWKKIVDSIKSVLNQFKETFINRYDQKVKYLDQNSSTIAKEKINHEITMPVITHENINKIDIPDLNYEQMKEHLKSRDAFIAKYFSDFAPKADGQSLSSNIKNSVIDPEKKWKNANQLNPTELYNYCKRYPKLADSISAMSKIIEAGEAKANNISKQIKESATDIDSMLLTYFNEFNAPKDDKSQDATGEKVEGKVNQDAANLLRVYFSVCGQVITTKMNVSQKVFDEYFAYLNWHIQQHGGNKFSGSEETAKEAEEKKEAENK